MKWVWVCQAISIAKVAIIRRQCCHFLCCQMADTLGATYIQRKMCAPFDGGRPLQLYCDERISYVWSGSPSDKWTKGR